MYNSYYWNNYIRLKDYGPDPFIVNIERITKQNSNFRTVLWTSDHLQVTLMSIKPGECIGLEVHPHVDQFLRIEQGQGYVQMGDDKDHLDFAEKVYDNYAIMVPAGIWHNLTNTGNRPLKLYTIYAPPEHPFGTIHKTKRDAELDEMDREVVKKNERVIKPIEKEKEKEEVEVFEEVKVVKEVKKEEE